MPGFGSSLSCKDAFNHRDSLDALANGLLPNMVKREGILPRALCGCALVKLARPGALLPTLAALEEASVGRLANSDPNVGRPSRLLFLSG